MKDIFGIDIGGTTVKIGLLAETGESNISERFQQGQRIMVKISFLI